MSEGLPMLRLGSILVISAIFKVMVKVAQVLVTGVKVNLLGSYGWRDNQLKQKLPGTTQFKSSCQHIEYVN